MRVLATEAANLVKLWYSRSLGLRRFCIYGVFLLVGQLGENKSLQDAMSGPCLCEDDHSPEGGGNRTETLGDRLGVLGSSPVGDADCESDGDIFGGSAFIGLCRSCNRLAVATASSAVAREWPE